MAKLIIAYAIQTHMKLKPTIIGLRCCGNPVVVIRKSEAKNVHEAFGSGEMLLQWLSCDPT